MSSVVPVAMFDVLPLSELSVEIANFDMCREGDGLVLKEYRKGHLS